MGTFTIPAELPVKIPFRMDTRVLLASLALSVLSALFCGLAPALQSTRLNLVNGTQVGRRGRAGGGRKRLWGRNALVVAQIAMSLMLLAASFLMFRGFQHSLSEGLGFAEQARDHVLMVRFDPRLVQYDAARTQRFYELLAERVRKRPESGARRSRRTLRSAWATSTASPSCRRGSQMPRDRENFTSTMDTVDEGYFETMGIPILRGRGFRASDTAGRAARRRSSTSSSRNTTGRAPIRWANASASTAPMARRSRSSASRRRSSTATAPDRAIDFVYLPLAQHPVARMVLLLRSSGDPLQLVQPVKDVVRSLDANMPMLETRTYEDLYRYSTVEGPRVAVELVGTLGAVGLLLAIAGLYGAGGVQREPPDARDRHSHGDRRAARGRAPPR